MNTFLNLNNKTILLTGASGFIGKNLLGHLINQKCKLILILRNKESLRKIKSFSSHKRVFIFFAVYVLYFGSQVDWFEED